MPNQIEIEIPLLEALKKLGGKAKPKQVYAEVTQAFPSLTPSDLAEQVSTGGNKWTNRIQWARQALVARAELSNRSHGVWEITEQGLNRLKGHTKAQRKSAAVPAAKESAVSAGSNVLLANNVNLDEVAETYLLAFKNNVLQKLHDLTPKQFEHFASSLLKSYGFQKIIVTGKAGDGGIDGHGQLKVGMAVLKAAFQCKRWDSSVGSKEVQAFRGAIQGQFEQGYFFTTSTFTDAAQKESIRQGAIPIVLFGGAQIIDIMIDRGIGVRRRPVEIYEDQLDTLFEAE